MQSVIKILSFLQGRLFRGWLTEAARYFLRYKYSSFNFPTKRYDEGLLEKDFLEGNFRRTPAKLYILPEILYQVRETNQDILTAQLPLWRIRVFFRSIMKVLYIVAR